MTAIRVLHVVTSMNLGGLESFIMNLYRSIDRTRVQFDFLVHRDREGIFDAEILKLGGRIFNVEPINPFFHRKYLASLKEFFKHHNEYQIVHSHINTYSMYVLRAAKEARIPVRISHAHTVNRSVELKLPFREYTKFRLREFATDYFACSVEAGKWMFRGDTNYTIINNSINVNRFRYNEPIRVQTRGQLGFKQNALVVGHVGAFRAVKNHRFLLDIFAALRVEDKNASLILVGDGALRKKIQKKASLMGISDSILFLGSRSDVNHLMQAMDLFILPSRYEGFPVVLVEAQVSGLPCLVSSAVSEEVKLSDKCSFVPLRKSAHHWALEAMKLAKNDDRSDAYERFKGSGYDITTVAQWMQSFYINMLEKNDLMDSHT